MNALKILFAAITFFIIAVSFTACKKNDVNNNASVKKPDCRIITVIGQTDTTHISYTSDGNISRLTSSNNSYIIYTYSGNTTIVREFNSSGTLARKTTVTLNASGLVANSRTEFDAAGTSWSNVALEYSGDEVSISTSTTSNGGTPTTTVFNWLNHNLFSQKTGSNVISYDYYTDKPWQKGDLLSYLYFTIGYGDHAVRNKNLIKTFQGTIYTYDFMTDGKISSISAGGVVILKYEYECN